MIQHPTAMFPRSRPRSVSSREVHADHLGARVDDRRRGHAHEDDHRAHGHDRPRERVEPVLEELGHRVDAAAQERRQEHERHDHEGDRGHPLVARDGDAEPVGRLAAHPDELLGGDVGGDQREPDEPPREPAPRQEVVARAVLAVRGLAAALVEAHPDHRGDERHEDDDVDRTHRVPPWRRGTGAGHRDSTVRGSLVGRVRRIRLRARRTARARSAGLSNRRLALSP